MNALNKKQRQRLDSGNDNYPAGVWDAQCYTCYTLKPVNSGQIREKKRKSRDDISVLTLSLLSPRSPPQLMLSKVFTARTGSSIYGSLNTWVHDKWHVIRICYLGENSGRSVKVLFQITRNFLLFPVCSQLLVLSTLYLRSSSYQFAWNKGMDSCPIEQIFAFKQRDPARCGALILPKGNSWGSQFMKNKRCDKRGPSLSHLHFSFHMLTTQLGSLCIY